MLKFKQFILEGGNIKVGDAQAAPFSVSKDSRDQRQKDIHGALSDLHDSFHAEHGTHLFGKGKKALNSGSIFAGSTKHLMHAGISHEEFSKHKPKVGDIDVQVPAEHKETLAKHLTPGKKLGVYTVAGIKKHGTEVSAVMKHPSGEHHQFDFEATEYHHDEPTKGEQFTHSSDWTDTKAGVKGAHHKFLLNAAGGSTHKFSITHGIRSRTDDSDQGNKDPEHVTKKLFGPKADSSKIHSFHGVTDLIKNHIPKEKHQEIYNKFKESQAKNRGMDFKPALDHLKKHLSVSVNESAESEVHHTTVIPQVGFSPISHMGHAEDLGSAMRKLPGTKHIGISGKADVFSPNERSSILSRQWNQPEVNHHIGAPAGEVISRAHDSLPKTGKKVLHILVGHDRADLAQSLKSSMEAGKLKEMQGKKFDEIHIHYPEGADRSHGMSGTKMRTAATASSIHTFHKHLGPMFSKDEASSIMNKVKEGLASGKIKVKR